MEKFFAFMVVSGFVTALMMLPGLAMMSLLFTFGLANLVFVPLITGFVYGLCFLPFAFFGRGGLVVSLPLAMALALGPNLIAQKKLSLVEQQATENDLGITDISRLEARVVSLIRVSNHHKINKAFDIGPLNECAQFCEALLRGNKVQFVQLGLVKDGEQQLRSTFHLVEGQIVESTVSEQEANLTFWIEENSKYFDSDNIKESIHALRVSLIGIGRVTVTTRANGHSLLAAPILRRTDVHSTHPAPLTILFPVFGDFINGVSKGGLYLLKIRKRSDRFTLWDIAGSLGLVDLSRVRVAPNTRLG